MSTARFGNNWDIMLGWGMERYPAIGKEKEELQEVNWSSFAVGSIIELNSHRIKLEKIDNSQSTIFLRFV